MAELRTEAGRALHAHHLGCELVGGPCPLRDGILAVEAEAAATPGPGAPFTARQLAVAMAEEGFAVPATNRDEQWDAPYEEAERVLARLSGTRKPPPRELRVLEVAGGIADIGAPPDGREARGIDGHRHRWQDGHCTYRHCTELGPPTSKAPVPDGRPGDRTTPDGTPPATSEDGADLSLQPAPSSTFATHGLADGREALRDARDLALRAFADALQIIAEPGQPLTRESMAAVIVKVRDIARHVLRQHRPALARLSGPSGFVVPEPQP